jgi:hypothetical protein
VQGDFDQIELYAEKVAELESFIAEQSEGEVRASGAAVTLEAKESELRIQQRYMLQLRGALGRSPCPSTCRTSWPRSGARRSFSPPAARGRTRTVPGAIAASAPTS